MRIIIICFFVALFGGKMAGQTTKVKMNTSMGNITLVLYDETPLHKANFIKLVKEKYYDGLLFHRVIDSFVIQGGDPNSKLANDTALLGEGDLGYTVNAEIMPDKYFHKKGALGMARDDNPEKASSACQFYIVEGKISNDSIIAKAKTRTGFTLPEAHEKWYRKYGGIPHLDSNYTVFGEVIKGLKVVDKISKVAKDENDRPKQNVYILKMWVVE